MSEGYDREPISARIPGPLRDDLDDWQEESEYGNRAAAIEGIIRDYLGSNPDPSPDPSREYHPDDAVLADIYSAVVTVSDGLVFDTDGQLGAVAEITGIKKEGIEAYLPRLMRTGFLAPKLRRNAEETSTRYHVKPTTADPEMWKYNPENRARREDEKRTRRHVRTLITDGHTPAEKAAKYREYGLEPPAHLQGEKTPVVADGGEEDDR